MNKLKLLFIDYQIPYLVKDSDYPNGPVGGAAVDQLALIKALVDEQYKVGILTWKGAKEYIGEETDFDIIYGETGKAKNPIKILKNIISSSYAIKRYNPDYLIYKVEGNPAIIALISKILKIPFIYRIASDADADNTSIIKKRAGVNEIYKFIQRYALKKAIIVFCQNDYQYRHLKNRFPNKEILIMHDFYDYHADFPKIKKFTERKYIAWIGRFVFDKNLPTLLDIVQSLPHIQFKIAGKKRDDIDSEIEMLLNQLSACANVTFVGYLNRKEIIPFLCDAYALLNTSHVEGFSRTFLEAFTAGTPIVTTKKVDPDNIIAKHNLGVVVNRYDELDNALKLLLNHNDFDNLSLRCRAYVVENHSPKVLVQKFIKGIERESV